MTYGTEYFLYSTFVGDGADNCFFSKGYTC